LSSSFVARDRDLLGNDHDEVVAGIDMRGEDRLVLAAQACASSVHRRPSVLLVASMTNQSRFHAIGFGADRFHNRKLEAPALNGLA